MTSQIRRAAGAGLQRAKRLLLDAGLPVEDLTVDHLAFVAIDGEEITGAIGVERYGRVGLLRSLVVAGHARQARLGQALVSSLETDLRQEGIQELWLLTIDADGYFARLGYETCDRSDAPEAIRMTREFSGLCPGDAVLMKKSLA